MPKSNMTNIILFILIAVTCVFLYRNAQATKAQAANNIAAEQTFLAANRQVENVMETPSGLQYLLLSEGNGTTHPAATSTVNVHYHGTLIDGTTFDSSVKRGEPISFGLNQVIPGWTEGLQLMKEGDKMRFFIPHKLAYGNRSVGKIPPASLLIFDVELLAIN
ncbi:peptidylprolyl isomerase [Pseudoalteromonas tunicata]|jgi:peptidylprolyl isomerase|uniref:Peptidyl-prolyl cis-trans isomerase n=2 Tax=Pseudoalteromonas tunicata TaxID=314281 RepID=A4C504_9GAMM|nr:peptidylprolyl isomerase [Pseudoalteromonas tunicata]EAR30636.1 Peptidyl-prolyl cis-trans isomerase, FKBP-type [Pseudoalteromonas tunicata D2]